MAWRPCRGTRRGGGGQRRRVTLRKRRQSSMKGKELKVECERTSFLTFYTLFCFSLSLPVLTTLRFMGEELKKSIADS
jgi:hypothetical protein